MVHGDVHQWNALESTDGFALVDPDGLLADAEYDLGIIIREHPVEGLSTGLLATSIGLQPVGDQMVHAAEVIARTRASPCGGPLEA